MKSNSGFAASKWVKLPIFSSTKELALLFSKLPEESLFPIGKVLSSKKSTISASAFLKVYDLFLTTFFEEKKMAKELMKQIAPLAIAGSLTDFECIKVKESEKVLRIIKPVIQLKWHFFRFSPLDQSFRSNVFSEDSIFWGLEFSYPQLYQDSETKKVVQVSSNYPNQPLWKIIRAWSRDTSFPTPVSIGNKRTNLTMRLGKDLFSMIDKHPDLKNREFKIGKQE